MVKLKRKFVALAVSSVVLGGCLSNSDDLIAPLTQGDLFVLTSANQLATVNKSNPSVLRTTMAITGLMSGDTLLGMDFRPRDGMLYAIARTSPGDGGRLYTINTTTGAATVVAALTAHPTDATAPFTTIDPAATSFGVDFNPVADALRVVSNTGQNLRIFVQTVAGQTPDRQAGFTFTDGNLTRTDGSATPFADTAAAYTNSFDGTTSTRIFHIDVTNNNLIQLQDPNGGSTRVAAPLFSSATTITGTTGFDIDASNNVGFAVLQIGGNQVLHSIAIPDSTATQPVAGPAATVIGNIGVSGVLGIALRPEAAPLAVALDQPATGSQRLLTFGIRTPNNAVARTITGLGAGERLISIDYRPVNDTVYGLSTTGVLYRLNTDTGAATRASTVMIAGVNPITTGIAAMRNYNADFNPVPNALRVVSTAAGTPETSENLRVPPAVVDGGGESIRDTDLTLAGSPTPADFSVGNIAYTNSFAGPQPTTTRLFDIDTRNHRLLLQNPPNDGILNVVATLSSTFTSYGGFNVSGGDNGSRLLAGVATGQTDFKLFNLVLDSAAANMTAPAAVAGTVSEFPSTGAAAVIGSGAAKAENVLDITVKF